MGVWGATAARLDKALRVEAGRQLDLPPQRVKVHGAAAHLRAQQHLREGVLGQCKPAIGSMALWHAERGFNYL